jgi:tyrosinase
VAISVELSLNGRTDQPGRYVTWTPSPCSARIVDRDGLTGQIPVSLRNATGTTGKVQFRTTARGQASDTIQLQLAANGSPSAFFVAGRFGSPSVADGDASIEVRHGSPLRSVGTFPLMVRIRKNAVRLTVEERRRFLSAFAMLNNDLFPAFRAVHTELTTDEAHGRQGFYPWHRAYLLDLERELQNIDPGVALPYWRFDQPAASLFTATYLGAPSAASPWAALAPSNPLAAWTTEQGVGIRRRLLFAPGGRPQLIGEAATIDPATTYLQFWDPTEINPHGNAHMNFAGDLSDPGTAPRDPLFFLLHCNVDRLWAKWQNKHRRFSSTGQSSYSPQGNGVQNNGPRRIGHCAQDSLWPWNGVTGGLRPQTAPRTPFPPSACTAAPGARPRVSAMVDFQGHAANGTRLGFDYDDVPYQPNP